uniref:Uncharacterized protein n=1 Tax=Aegilops tauschii subsp. strangulata TaxID=200361 RepID=A0A453DQA2_AEGTS
MAPAQIDVRMDVALLHCQACLLPLKPPVFKVISPLLSSSLTRESSNDSVCLPGSRICLEEPNNPRPISLFDLMRP